MKVSNLRLEKTIFLDLQQKGLGGTEKRGGEEIGVQDVHRPHFDT